MWIEEIFISDFGAWHQLRLSGLQPGLNLIVGSNEAGKSTILEFVRSVLVGFGKRTARVNSYEPANGAMRCGWLQIRSCGGDRLRLERVERQGCKNGVLTVVNEDGCRVEGAGIAGLEEGFDTAILDTLFAFDLDRMRQLDQKALRAKIVATALGSAETNPLDIIKSVEERLKTLGRRSVGDGKTLAALQAQLRDTDTRLKAIAELPSNYEALKKQSEKVSRRISEIAREIEAREDMLLCLNDTLACHEPWKNLVALDREIAQLGDARHFPLDGLLRLEKALERKREISDNLIETENALEHLSAKLERLAPDRRIAANLDTIETLSRRAGNMADLPAVIGRTTDEIAQAIKIVEQQLSPLGVDWDRQKLAEWLPSVGREEEIRSLSQSHLACSDRIRGLEMRLQECSDRIARHKERIAVARKEVAALEHQASGYLDWGSRRKLQQCLEAGQNVLHLQERLADKNERLQTLILEREVVLTGLKKLESGEQAAPFRAFFWTLVIALAIGGSSLLLVASRLTDGPYNLITGVGMSLLCSILGLAGWRFHLHRIRRSDMSKQREALLQALSRCRAEMAANESQRRSIIMRMASWRREAQQSPQEVLGDPNAEHQAILEAQERADAAEEPFRRRTLLEETLKSDASQVESEQKYQTQVAHALQAAKAELAGLRKSLTERFAAMGLRFEGHPSTAPELMSRLHELAGQARQLISEEERLAGIRRTWAAFTKDVDALAQALGRPLPDGQTHVAEVNNWATLAAETRELLSRRDATGEQISEQQCRVAALSRKMDEAQARIDELFQAAGAADEEAFRKISRRCEHLHLLAQKRSGLLDSLVTASGYCDEAELFAYLKGCDWEQIKQDQRLMLSETEDLRKEAQELSGREGRLQQEIETLEAAEETENLLALREMLLAQLDEAVNDWTHLRLASMLLEKTLRIYELDKQPRVLERSSEIFRAITGGAFSRVLFPFDEDRLKAERPDGSRLDEATLSRGTLEQLYLAVRLAYIDVYRPKDSALPLLMDDILVNFDAERSANAAQVLSEVSQEMGLQVLFFTCHPHVADLFSGNVVEVQLGPDNARAEATCLEIAPIGGWLR